MKKKITIAHLASFSGNTGDALSHLGFRPWFESFFDVPVIWKNFEIRDSYRGITDLDTEYLNLVNDSDLGVIGGGNYLELWPENSQTGTSLNFNLEKLNSLNKPIFLNSLGVDDGQGIGTAAKLNFSRFIGQLQLNPARLLSVRNDGSFETISKLLPDALPFFEIPDHGFFGAETFRFTKKSLVPSIAVNIALDMPLIRFAGFESLGDYFRYLASALCELVDKNNFELVFVPHVFSDVEAIYEILNLLPDRVRREQTRVVGLDTTSNSFLDCYKAYLESELVVASRFHANVFSISHNIPTISISNYPQLKKLHEKLGNDMFLSVPLENSESFSTLVAKGFKLIHNYKNSIPSNQNTLMKSIHRSREVFGPTLDRWLTLNKLK